MIFIYSIFIMGLLVILGLAFYAFKRLARGWSFKILFKDFNRKLWMTTCLGILFLALYCLLIGWGFLLVHHWKVDLFSLVYQHPTKFVYGGLWLFALLSLTIYFARMLIKYFYLTRGKDS